MNNQERIQEMTNRLENALHPSFLNITDDSAAHIGHAGAASGAGHFTVEIAAEALSGLSKVQSHQKIYGVLGDMIPDEIHALRIVTR